MNYKLAHPEKLFKALLYVIGGIIVLVLIGKLFGHNKNQEASAEESETAESSEVNYAGIQTFSTQSDDLAMKGTLRSVSSILPESMGDQLAAYMSSMLLSNLENVKTSMLNYMNSAEDPLLGYDPSNYRYIVGINPTRGGAEKGYTVDNAVEKDITFEVARVMIDYLNDHNDGYYFFLTRETDTTKTDAARMNLAEKYQADMLITLACNASEDELGGTIGTYYSKEETLWAEAYQALQEGQTEDDIEIEMTDEEKVRDILSKELAEVLMDACADGFGMWSRFPEVEDTVRTNNPYVSVVIYMGYLTYEFDRNLATDQLCQQQAGEAMAKALLEFLEDEAPVRTVTEKIEEVHTVDDYDPDEVRNLTDEEYEDYSSERDKYKKKEESSGND